MQPRATEFLRLQNTANFLPSSHVSCMCGRCVRSEAQLDAARRRRGKQDLSRECASSAKLRAYPRARRPGTVGSERCGKVHPNANSCHDHETHFWSCSLEWH